MWRGTKLRPSRIKGLRPLRHITAQFTFSAEHAVDLESGALVGITVQPADLGDTTTVGATLEAAEEALGKAPETVVTDKGYHSGAVVLGLEENGQRAVIPEP